MGHRCNYVLREGGELTLYYSHWGALTVPRDFFWGLDAARDFLDQHDPVDEDEHGWLDDVFGEGGAALDIDTRTLTIDGGEIYGHARDLLFELMQVVWARDGFTVRDADSFIDLATAVGLPASTVEASHLPHEPIDVADDSCTGRGDGYLTGLVLLDGVPRFVGRGSIEPVLELGADRLADLERLPDLAEAKHLLDTKPLASWEVDCPEKPTLGSRIHSAVVIDTKARRIEGDAFNFRRGTTRAYYATKWPGYTFGHYDSIGSIFARIAHPDLPVGPPEPAPPIEDQLGEIEHFLFGSRSDPATWIAQIAEPGSWINPHALVSPVDGRPDSAPKANTIFRSVVAEVLAKRRR